MLPAQVPHFPSGYGSKRRQIAVQNRGIPPDSSVVACLVALAPCARVLCGGRNIDLYRVALTEHVRYRRKTFRASSFPIRQYIWMEFLMVENSWSTGVAIGDIVKSLFGGGGNDKLGRVR